MRAAAAADAFRAPGNDFIEQAHAPAMGNAAFDPRAVQVHGSTFTNDARDQIQGTRAPPAANRPGRCDSSGRQRAAGIERRKEFEHRIRHWCRAARRRGHVDARIELGQGPV